MNNDNNNYLLDQARLKEFESQWGTMVADAMTWFDNAAFYHARKENLRLQADNTVLAYQNKMNALDNQVLNVKNQLQDKFNTAVANDVVSTAARGIRVSMSNILEKHKESAHNINTDIKMLESNARMDKALYKSYQEQARISEKMSKYLLTSELAQSSIKLGIDIISAAAGGAGGAAAGESSGMSFGNIMKTLGTELGSTESKNKLAQAASDYIGSIWG